MKSFLVIAQVGAAPWRINIFLTVTDPGAPEGGGAKPRRWTLWSIFPESCMKISGGSRISQTGGANFRRRKSLLCGKMKEIGPGGRVLSASPLDPKILPESRKFLCPSEKMYQKIKIFL